MKIYICYHSDSINSCIIKKKLYKEIKNVIFLRYDKIIIDSNSIYIFIKHFDINLTSLLLTLKSKNNYLIYEPLDKHWNIDNFEDYKKQMIKYFHSFDHILCNNKQIMDIYIKIYNKINYSLLYHHNDTRLYTTNIKSDNIYYIGNLSKTSLTKNDLDKFNIKYINGENMNLINKSYCGIHIDYILEDKTYYNIHTSTKLITSLCYDSIFICNKVPIYIELLGNDYEYFITNNIELIINKAKTCINNKNKYQEYLNKMKPIKKRLLINNISKDLNNIINNIDYKQSNKVNIITINKNYNISAILNDKNITSIIKNITCNHISYYKFNGTLNITLNGILYKLKNIVYFKYNNLPFNIITKNNIDNFIKTELNNYNKAIIFGKGPSFISRKKENNNELYFGINQTVNFLDNNDFLCINDLHNIYKIDDISKIKYLLIPEYLHINGKFDINGHWYNVFKDIRFKFTGSIIIYNLRSSPIFNNQFITIPECKTTSNSAVNFICIYINKYINEIKTYGIGKNYKNNYHKNFIGNGNYKQNRINTINSEIKKNCLKFKIKLSIL
jgi:hypothetical protein